MPISVVIPNYNGLSLLKTHLPSVIKHAPSHEIIVVDDASTDQSVQFIAATYPQILLIKNPHNLGFARSVNLGVSYARHPLILLLNTDVSINAFTIPNLIKKMSSPQIFAVGCLEKLPGSHQRGRSTASFTRGLFIHKKATTLSGGKTAWVFAASGLYQKSLWQNLGGLDPLFYPAYYEDIDICYRAWKSGLVSVYEPSATVKHLAEATMSKTLSGKKATIGFKNQLLFTWKNITDPKLITKHCLWLPYHLVITSLRTKGAFLRGFIMALKQLLEVMHSRPGRKYQLTDDQVFALFSDIK